MKVPFVAYDKQHKKYRKEIEDAMLRIARSRARILQNEVRTFEERLAAYIGTKYAVGVASGTDALFLSLKLAGIGPGDEVITVGHTFLATPEAMHWNLAKPILVNVKEDGMMDMQEVQELCKQRQIKAVIPVHLMGDMCDMDELQRLSAAYGFKIIEDACQALGSSLRNKKAGAWGLTGCFSFFPAKILGCYGDGGAVTTDDEGLAKELKDMREHYKRNPGKYGFNSRLDELQAAILNVKFNHIEEILSARKHIADIYNALISGIPGLQLPINREGRVWQDYIVRTERRDELKDFLEKEGIETMKNDYRFPGDLSKSSDTIRLESQTLRLPCHDVLKDKEALYVCTKVKQFFGG